MGSGSVGDVDDANLQELQEVLLLLLFAIINIIICNYYYFLNLIFSFFQKKKIEKHGIN